jgi:hypothetical protein
MKYLKFFICFLVNIFICFYISDNYDLLILSTYLLILSYCSFFVFFNKKNISLDIVFYLFIYFFFGIAPVVQYKDAVFFFRDKSPLLNEDFINGGIITLLILGLYTLISKVLNNKINFNFTILDTKTELNSGRLYSVLLVLVIVVLGLNYNNYLVLFFRHAGSRHTEFVDYFKSTMDTVISLVPVIILLYLKTSKKIKLKDELLLLLIIVFFNFPMAVSRFEVGLVYFSLILMYFKFIQVYFKEFFIIGILFVFPFLNKFRYKGTVDLNNSNPFGQFNELDFDSFQNTIGIIKQDIITNGEQLMASLFFFIPRMFWTNKPTSSASLLCENLDFDGYCNVAISFFGEGYINFGVFGLITFVIILALYNTILDKFFYKCDFLGYKLIYFLFLFHEFYLLRGSLTAATIKFFIITFAIILFLFLKRIFMVRNINL